MKLLTNIVKNTERFDENANQFYYIIGTPPPYVKQHKSAPEALAMPQVCYGSPNLYFLFGDMGIYKLKEGRELV